MPGNVLPKARGRGQRRGGRPAFPSIPVPHAGALGRFSAFPYPAPRFLSKRDLCSDMQQNLPFQPRLAKQARKSHVVGDAGNARSACRAVIPDQSHRKAWEVSHRAGDGAELGHRDHGSASGPRDSGAAGFLFGRLWVGLLSLSRAKSCVTFVLHVYHLGYNVCNAK